MPRARKELSKYERVNLEAARLLVYVESIGNEIEDKDVYAHVREEWDQYVEGVIHKLGEMGDETVVFGEAYDT